MALSAKKTGKNYQDISFETTAYSIADWIIIRLPKTASAKLPSRGQAMVEGIINGVSFQTPLEPDGNWSHWFRIDKDLQKAVKLSPGDHLKIKIKAVEKWPNPSLPVDLKKALSTSSQANDLWQQITPMARWEWVRWIRSTGSKETRQRRIEVAISKLKAGKRRPCCWNRNLSSEPSVSKNGVLLDPLEA